MISTLLRRVTVSTLDQVEGKGLASSRSTVRGAAKALHRARSVLGLDAATRQAPLPPWREAPAERPMWSSDQKKLRKFQLEHGILKDEAAADQEAQPAKADASILVYYKRGCPHARAAMDLLREREIAFDERDVKGDDMTLSWLKTVTGSPTTPQIFIHGESIGGHDELRALDQSGELLTRLGKAEAGQSMAAEVATTQRSKQVRLPVVHPERSPFEAGFEPGLEVVELRAENEDVLEGDALLQRVNAVLDECRPLVKADGGDIELLDIQGDVVHVQLTGNCVGCPSAQATLRQGIERRLLAQIPQLKGLASPQLTPAG